ncbi:PRC-barrel domain-containing protein [Caldanaerobius polysaccharolyticus]|uniref:PRC-barrel domain-containing protein n=1 Tax=Caldanaerobius polysaccharolyticus TaxID=44256 RepID=UPI00047D5C4A|nr:PRC-barrel domain-containing protein [Caldanaerobius polysaccharolyticus]
MIKASSLLNIAVYCRETGKKVGYIKDIVYEPSKGSIAAYVVSSGSVFKNLKILMANDVADVGKDRIVIKSEKAMKDADKYHDMLVNQNSHLIGSSVRDFYGRELGIISDTVVDVDSNLVKGYIVSDGLISDILKGRNFIEKNEAFVEESHEGGNGNGR